MANNEFDKWDLKQAEWRGYAIRALEDMNSEIRDLKKQFNRMEEKIDKVNQRLTNTQLKVAGLSATVSLIVTIVIGIFFHVLG